MQEKKLKLTIRDITLIGLMVAIIEASKAALLWAPNIELTSFWIVMFTLYFREKIIFVVPVFTVIEGMLYGFHLWCFMYLYIWFILSFITYLFRNMNSAVGWGIISGLFGLFFGFLCSFVYFIIGLPQGIGHAVRYAFGWWVAGIPYDMPHAAGNFIIMLVLYRPISKIMKKADKLLER